MATVIRIISTSKRVSQSGKPFYLSKIIADDQEEYSLTGADPPQVGDEIWTDFSDRWNKPIAGYNHNKLDNNNHNEYNKEQ